MRIMKIGLLILLALIGNLAFLLLHNPLPETHSQQWPLQAIEQQFDATPVDKLPLAIHSETIAHTLFPHCFAVAGCAELRTRADFTSFQIRYADGSSIVIDLIHDETMHRAMPFMSEIYNSTAAERMITAAKQADHVVFTHEHFDHLQGLKALLQTPELQANAALNRAQASNPMNLDAGFDAADMEQMKQLVRLNDDDYQLLAPGFAIIRTPGHSLGSQSFYIQLQNGQRFLFSGDIVWSEANLLHQQGKPLLASMVVKEDSETLNQQIRYLIELQQQRPELNLVIAHAGEQLQRYHQQKLITPGFQVIK